MAVSISVKWNHGFCSSDSGITVFFNLLGNWLEIFKSELFIKIRLATPRTSNMNPGQLTWMTILYCTRWLFSLDWVINGYVDFGPRCKCDWVIIVKAVIKAVFYGEFVFDECVDRLVWLLFECFPDYCFKKRSYVTRITLLYFNNDKKSSFCQLELIFNKTYS